MYCGVVYLDGEAEVDVCVKVGVKVCVRVSVQIGIQVGIEDDVELDLGRNYEGIDLGRKGA